VAEEAIVRNLRADEAPELVRCFERCYGDSYVDPSFQDAERLRERVERGRLRSVVAVTPSGEIVGHMGLSLRREGDTTVDAGNTVVDPRFRNQQLAGRLGLALAKRCREEGFTAFHHYPTTAHPAVQKLAVRGGGIETGVMLDYIPASTTYRELDASADAGPWAVVVVYQPIAKAPARTGFLPARYEKLLLELVAKTGLERRWQPPAPALAGETRLEPTSEPRRRLLRVHVERAGADLAERVRALLAEIREVDAVMLDLALADPGVSAAVEALRPTGFRFAALLPDFREGDLLRLQHLPGRSGNLPRPEVATDDARALVDLILRDRG
jgi:serine/threonine-protein kinase RsbW